MPEEPEVTQDKKMSRRDFLKVTWNSFSLPLAARAAGVLGVGAVAATVVANESARRQAEAWKDEQRRNLTPEVRMLEHITNTVVFAKPEQIGVYFSDGEQFFAQRTRKSPYQGFIVRDEDDISKDMFVGSEVVDANNRLPGERMLIPVEEDRVMLLLNQQIREKEKTGITVTSMTAFANPLSVESYLNQSNKEGLRESRDLMLASGRDVLNTRLSAAWADEETRRAIRFSPVVQNESEHPEILYPFIHDPSLRLTVDLESKRAYVAYRAYWITQGKGYILLTNPDLEPEPWSLWSGIPQLDLDSRSTRDQDQLMSDRTTKYLNHFTSSVGATVSGAVTPLRHQQA